MRLQKIILALFLACLASSFVFKSEDNCRFAKQFKTQDFLQDPQKVDDFLRKFIRWQTNFIKKIGVDSNTGFTFDGIRIDVSSGEPLPDTLHRFTASSKQCIHLAIMAKVLEEQQFADEIYDIVQVFRILEKKVATLQKFYSTYPGFAGFMPWVMLDGSGIKPTYDFQSRVPALDNGEMFWAALALSRVWEKKYPNVYPQLRNRFDEVFWKGMIRNVRKVFFNETSMKIRAVADIKDVKLPLESNEYTNSDNYYLDDPYEGQMFIWIITLLAKDQFTAAEIDYIWTDKRKKLQSVDYVVKSLPGKSITVERGFWFSSHEQWKLLFLPYYTSQTYKTIQLNNEKARSWHSVDNSLPGMFGCQAGPAEDNTEDTGYFCSGIEEIAFQKIQFDKLVTPYGAFPLLLINKEIGAAWLHNSLYSPCGQTKYGALEGTGLTGQLMSPVLTWDTKITAALAVMNGTIQIITDYLQENNLLAEFTLRIQNEYKQAFSEIAGQDLDLPLPNKQIQTGRPDFTTCE